jgi:hypothetical protein
MGQSWEKWKGIEEDDYNVVIGEPAKEQDLKGDTLLPESASTDAEIALGAICSVVEDR